MLKTPNDLGTLSLFERHLMATHYLLGLETVLRTLAKAMPGASFTYHSPLDTGETCPALPQLGTPSHTQSPQSLPLSPQSYP